MSQMENLLNSVSEEISTVDHVVIGKDRFMVIPDHIKKLGVSPDHGVNTVKFVGPRYSENGTDLSTMSIWVNYMRSDGYMDAGRCENIKVDAEDDTLLHYEWKITRNVTEVHGNLTVLVCAKSVDAQGNEENHWNSELNHDFYISEGMEVQETVLSQYPDIIEHLLLRMATVENKTTQAAMLNYVEQYLDQDPSVIIEKIEELIAAEPIQEYVNGYLDEHVDVATTEERTLEGSYPGAYEMVNMKGASEQKHLTGKNLFDVTAALANQKRGTTDVTNAYTAYGNGVQTSQNSYGNGRSYMYLQLDPGSYNISANVSVESGWNFSVKNYDADTELINQTAIEDGSISYQFVLDASALIGFCFMSVEGSGPATYVTNIQLEIGDAASEYEEYCGGMAAPNFEYEQEIKSVGPEVTVKTVNKNILNNTAGTVTQHGVTFTRNNDKTITANGTATGNIYFSVGTVYLKQGEYKLSGCTGGNKSTYIMYIQDPDDSSGYAHFTDGELTYTMKEDGKRKVLIAVYTGATLTNQVFKPMLSIEGGEYEPYRESSATITLSEPIRGKNGIVDIIEKRNSKWGVLRRWKKGILDAINFTEITWTEYENVTFFTLPKPEDSLVYQQYLTIDAMCNKFRCDTVHPLDQIDAVGNINTAASAPSLWFGFEKGTTLEEARTAGEIEYIYQLVEPVWEELDAASQIALDSLEVYDGITHVLIEGSDVQPVVVSRYGTSHWGARAIDNTNRIEKLEELLGVGNVTNFILGISQGGTGGATAAEARQNLEVYSKAEVNKLLGDVNAVLESLIGGE